ncbi:MAG: hypothetical protein WBL63_24325 [Candidatus Acidiferrum sp.]
MTKVISFLGTAYLHLPEPENIGDLNSRVLKIAYYRRLLSELRLRPRYQRVFLRMLLKRALATDTTTDFPVTNHAVQDPVSPS